MSVNPTVQPKLVLSCQPRTERAQPCKLNVNKAETSLIYTSGRHIYLRDLETQNTRVISNHQTTCTVAQYSSDEKYILSGDGEGTLKVTLNNDTFSEKYSYPVLAGKVVDIASSWDSSKVVVAGYGSGRFASCISLDSGTSYGELMGHSKPILATDFKLTRTDPRVVTGGMDFSTILYQGNPYRLLKVNRDHRNTVFDVKFDRQGKTYTSVGADKLICVYDATSGNLLNQMQSTHSGSILGFSYSKDGTQLVTSSTDKSIQLVDIPTSKVIGTCSLGDTFDQQQVANLWLDKYILALSLNGDLNYLDRTSGQKIKTVQGYQQPITALQVDVSNETLFTGSSEGRVHRWDLLQPNPTYQPQLLTKGPEAKVVSFSRLDSFGVQVVSADDTVRTIQPEGTSLSEPIKLSSEPAASCTVDATTLAIATLDDQIHLVKGSQPITSAQLVGTPTFVTYIQPHNLLLVGIQGKPIQTLEVRVEPVSLRPTTGTQLTHCNLTTSTYHLETNKLALGDGNGKIYLYDTSTVPFTLITSRWSFHTAKITSLQFNGSGSLLCSGAVDGYIYLWFPNAIHTKVALGKVHTDPITQVQFGTQVQNKVQLFSTATDGTLKQFELDLVP